MTTSAADASGTTQKVDALGSTSALDDLQSIAPLILNVDLRDEVLARYDAPRRLVAEGALQFAGQLIEVTAWNDKELLTKLGCELKTVGDLTRVSLVRLERCQKFLRLLSVLTGIVDIVSDRRAVVVECARLLRATGQDADGLQDLVEAKELIEQSKITPVDYIRLGEISAAADLARSLAGIAGRIAAPPEGYAGPFDGLPTVHLSTARIEMYVSEGADSLGAVVTKHIAAHVEQCEPCAQAIEYCRSYMNPD